MVGTTPATVDGVQPGSHIVRVSHTGYTAVERTIDVREGAVVSVDIRLEVATGSSRHLWLSQRDVTSDDLHGKSCWELSLLRNETYAIHGYRFRSAQLRSTSRS